MSDDHRRENYQEQAWANQVSQNTGEYIANTIEAGAPSALPHGNPQA